MELQGITSLSPPSSFAVKSPMTMDLLEMDLLERTDVDIFMVGRYSQLSLQCYEYFPKFLENLSPKARGPFTNLNVTFPQSDQAARGLVSQFVGSYPKNANRTKNC